MSGQIAGILSLQREGAAFILAPFIMPKYSAQETVVQRGFCVIAMPLSNSLFY